MTDTEPVDRDAIIAKIQKIMALAGNNPSEAEAASAAIKVGLLLAKYKLSDEEVKAHGKTVGGEIVINNTIVTDTYPWRMPIGAAIARMYFCHYYREQIYEMGEKLKAVARARHSFVGKQADTMAAALMFDYLWKTVERLAREGAKSRPAHEHSAYRTTFRQMCAARLDMRITEKTMAAMKGTATEVNDAGEATGRNLPALMSTYENAKVENQKFMEGKGIVLKTKRIVPKNLHAGGAVDGIKAANAIGLDTQINGRAPAKGLSATKQIGKQ